MKLKCVCESELNENQAPSAAERDLEIGADFYASQCDGLGIYFTDCLISDIESLNLYARIHEKHLGLFRMLAKRFPFTIDYDEKEELIEVFAVLDCRQDPSETDAILKSR